MAELSASSMPLKLDMRGTKWSCAELEPHLHPTKTAQAQVRPDCMNYAHGREILVPMHPQSWAKAIALDTCQRCYAVLTNIGQLSGLFLACKSALHTLLLPANPAKPIRHPSLLLATPLMGFPLSPTTTREPIGPSIFCLHWGAPKPPTFLVFLVLAAPSHPTHTNQVSVPPPCPPIRKELVNCELQWVLHLPSTLYPHLHFCRPAPCLEHLRLHLER
ncbi:hypothetical protein B0H17DRAFT_1152076 [Mycena rosella]|uniref:Uncharacterized protein n=1 Tax=Mycena rosella TaxID=1033263 RepID=A0AAD7BGB9_MYCRO|nr:hypothetical protein B0H17DRAFT_1152076 [Mycena rosella]